TYAGRVAQTFFYSTSGGRTLSAEDAWGKPIPYLVSVPDPYDSISPYHDWGPLPLTAAKLAKALKSPGPLLDVQTTANASGRDRAARARPAAASRRAGRRAAARRKCLEDGEARPGRRQGRLRRAAPACERELPGARGSGKGVRSRDDARARGCERLTRAAAAL